MKTRILLGSVLLASAMSACNDESEINVAAEQLATESVNAVYGVRIVDAAGNEISALDGNFTEAFVEVEAEGDWNLSTQNSNFVYLTTEVGHGNARIPVFVTTCWAKERSFSIEAAPLGSNNVAEAATTRLATRGDDAPASTGTITEDALFDMATINNRLSSNLGAGYSVSVATTNNILMKTQLQLFNLKGLADLSEKTGIKLIDDDLTPQLEQKYMESNSYKQLRQDATVGLEGNINSGKLEGSGLSGDFGYTDNSDSSSYYAVRRQISKLYTRTIDYASINALDADESYSKYALAPGFRMMRDSLQAQLLRYISGPESTNNTKVAYQLVDAFIREVGPNFICKASMGCSLDYFIKIDSAAMDDSLSVKAVLDVKYESQVKDTAKTVVDSTKVTANLKGSLANKAKQAASNTEVEIVINGGDVSAVDVLCNGGVLTNADIRKWQQSIKPEKAVMVEMEIAPISALFNNEKVKLFIYNYLVAQGLTERYADNVLTPKK